MLSTLLDFSENTGPLKVYTNIYVCVFVFLYCYCLLRMYI